MTNIVIFGSTSLRFPAWARGVPGATGIKAQPGDDEKHMAFSDVDGNPVAIAFFPVIKEVLRHEGLIEFPACMKDIGSRT